MTERLTDKDLREWHKTAAGFHTLWPSSTVYAMTTELLELRARIKEIAYNPAYFRDRVIALEAQTKGSNQ